MRGEGGVGGEIILCDLINFIITYSSSIRISVSHNFNWSRRAKIQNVFNLYFNRILIVAIHLNVLYQMENFFFYYYLFCECHKINSICTPMCPVILTYWWKKLIYSRVIIPKLTSIQMLYQFQTIFSQMNSSKWPNDQIIWLNFAFLFKWLRKLFRNQLFIISS